MKQHTICISPDINCSNISIEWIGSQGLLIPCEKDNCITIALDPYDTSGQNCLEGFIICLNADGSPSCENCEPIAFKKCFCSTKEDCGPNGICDENGVCQDICTQQELLEGKEPFSDGCKCPPNLPFFDAVSNKCSECISGSVHPNNSCVICDNGFWVQKDCGDNGICSEDYNGDCIEDCSSKTDGRVRYNPDTKTCDCSLGYVWNPITKKCDVKLGDCPDGTERDPITKICNPIECPDGYIYSIVDKQCVVAPCDDNPCANGLECDGVNCGCSETSKKCVDCIDQPNALGCNSDDPDNPTPCDNGGDCEPGFGCYKGECVDCDNFSEKDKLTIPGCGNNEQYICNDKNTLKIDECGIISKLDKKETCQCEFIGVSVKRNSISITGKDSTLIDELDKATYHVVFEADLRKSFSTSSAAYESYSRFNNQTINNEIPIAGSVAITVTPVVRSYDENGQFTIISLSKIDLDLDLSEQDPNLTSTVRTSDLIELLSNSIERDVDDNIIGGMKLIGYKLQVNTTNFEFYNNCTYNGINIYSSNSNQLLSVTETSKATYITIGKLNSSSSKNPLLKWSRNDVVFRSLYISKDISGKYEDKLFGPEIFTNNSDRGKQTLDTPEGELLPMNKYTAEYDCTCDPKRTINNLIICDIEFVKDTHFKILTSSSASSICNDKITILENFDVCDINKNLEEYGWDASTVSQYQTKYDLKLNNTRVATFIYNNVLDYLVLDDGSNTAFKGYSTNITEQITSVSLEMNHGSGTCFKQTDIFINTDVNITTECTDSNNFNIKITEVLTSPIEKVRFLGSDTFYSNTPITLTNISYSTSISSNPTIEVFFESGCKKLISVPVPNCCDKETLDVQASAVLGSSGTINLIVETSNKSELSDILINNTSVFTNFNEVSNVYTGTYQPNSNDTSINIIAKTISGCSYSLVVGIPGEIDGTLLLDSSSICSGETTALTLTVSNGANKSFVISGPQGDIQGTTDNSGIFTTQVSSNGNYTLTEYDSITGNYGIVANLTIINAPTINSFTVANNGAQGVGNTVTFNITGSPNAEVNLNYNSFISGVSSIFLDSNGDGSFTGTLLAIGTATVTIDSIILNSCITNYTTEHVVSVTILDTYSEPDVVDLLVYDSTTSDPTILATSSEGAVKFYSDPGHTTLLYTGSSFQTTGSQVLYVRVEGSKAPSNTVVVEVSKVTITPNTIDLNNDDTGGSVANICVGSDGLIGLNVDITGTSGFQKPIWGLSDFSVQWWSNINGTGTLLGTNLTQLYGYDANQGSVILTLKDPSSTSVKYIPVTKTFNFTITENAGCNPCFYYTVGADFTGVNGNKYVEGQDAIIQANVLSGGTGPYDYTLLRFGVAIQTITNSALTTVNLTIPNVQWTGSEGNYTVVIRDTSNGCEKTVDLSLVVVEYTTTIGSYNCALGNLQVQIDGGTSPLSLFQIGVFVDEILAGYLYSGSIGYTTSNPFTLALANDSGIRKVSINAGSTYNASSSIYSESMINTGCINITNDGAEFETCIDQAVTFSATISGGTLPYNYVWRNPLGTSISSGSSSNLNNTLLFTPTSTDQGGTYTIEITDANGAVVSASYTLYVVSYNFSIDTYNCTTNNSVVSLTTTVKPVNKALSVDVKVNSVSTLTFSHESTINGIKTSQQFLTLTPEALYNISYSGICDNTIDATYSACCPSLLTITSITPVGASLGITESCYPPAPSENVYTEFSILFSNSETITFNTGHAAVVVGNLIRILPFWGDDFACNDTDIFIDPTNGSLNNNQVMTASITGLGNFAKFGFNFNDADYLYGYAHEALLNVTSSPLVPLETNTSAGAFNITETSGIYNIEPSENNSNLKLIWNEAITSVTFDIRKGNGAFGNNTQANKLSITFDQFFGTLGC